MFIISILILIILIPLAVTFLTLNGWKILGYMELQKGPNIVGPGSLLQASAGAVKFFFFQF